MLKKRNLRHQQKKLQKEIEKRVKKEVDKQVNKAKEDTSVTVTKAEMYLSLVRPFISVDKTIGSQMEVFNDILRQIKILLSPITPPNYEIESAAAMFMSESGLRVPKGAVRHRNPELSAAETKKTTATSKKKGSGNPPRAVRHSRPARSI